MLAATLAAGCGASSGEGASEPSGPPIEDVDIAGNEGVGDDEIIDGLATHGPTGLIFKDYARYDPTEVDRDIERIESYYKREGYFSARVLDVEVREMADRVEVRFEVDEGRATRIEAMEISGLPERLRGDSRIQELRDRFEIGEVYDHETYEQAKLELRQILASKGYARAEVEGVVEVDRDRAEAAIRVTAQPGPLIRYGETEVSGLEDVPESAVRHRLMWKPGEIYDPAHFRETRSQLYELGYFRGVRLDLAETGEAEEVATADVNLRLNEVQDRELRLGGGFALDNATYEVRARAGYTMHHFLHPLSTLRFDARPAYTVVRGETGERGIAGEGTVSLNRHDLVYPRVLGETRLTYRQMELESYSSRGPSARLNVGRPFFDGSLSVGVGWEIRRLTFPRIHPAIGPEVAEEIGLVEPYRVAYFDQFIALDRRGNILAPRDGYYLELRLEEGGVFAGGKFDYARASSDARVYVPIVERLVAAARIKLGYAFSGELPITQRYFGGGASSHRGFGNRQLAPTVAIEDMEGAIDTAQIGGNALLESSVELRFDVARLWERWFGIVTFLDAGDVTRELGDIELGNPHLATGLGVRYATPVGPIRVDVGYRLNRYGPGEPEPGTRWAFHLSLGEAF